MAGELQQTPSPLAGEGRGEGYATRLRRKRLGIAAAKIALKGFEPFRSNPSPGATRHQFQVKTVPGCLQFVRGTNGLKLPQGERGELYVARARALIGTRFRLHGRDPASGLDCVGLIVCACPSITRPPDGYALRGGTADGFAAMFVDNGMTAREGELRAGDILLLQPSAAQFHLGIWSGESLIHADGVLRCVVETPGALAWPLVSGWYFN